MHTLKERTYVNRDSTKVVPEGSPEAAFLLGGEGDEISDETAKRLGLGTEVATSPAYGKMKVDELSALVSERGIVVDSGAKKADLVDALEAADAAGNGAEENAPADDQA